MRPSSSSPPAAAAPLAVPRLTRLRLSGSQRHRCHCGLPPPCSRMPTQGGGHTGHVKNSSAARARLVSLSSRPDIPALSPEAPRGWRVLTNARASVELGRPRCCARQPLASGMAGRRSSASTSTSRRATGDEEDLLVSTVSEEQETVVGFRMSWPLLVVLCSVGILICYADRSNIATAILPMSAEFDWDKSFQGFVLSAFFGGYMLTQVLGGRLADQYGGKNVLAFGVSVWSLCTVATPWAASWGTAPLVACRVALGVGEGVAFPAVHSLIARSVPRKFQSTAVAAVTAASYLGTAAAFGLSPVIIQDYGWEWSFYIFGGLAVLWLPAWLPFEPPVHRRPAPSSIDQIISSPGETGVEGEQQQLLPPTVQAASIGVDKSKFLQLLRQRQVLAICVAQYTQSWGLYGLINWLPTFFNEYYHVEIGQLGGLTMLPYVVQGGMGAVSGVVADSLISGGVAVRTVRVSLQVIGMLGPAACLVAATSPWTAGNAEGGSLIITLGLGLSALTLGGVSVSHLDIAPRNAGLVFGAGNTLATLAGLLAVPVNGMLLDATGSWALVFGLTAGHYVVGSIVWAAWAGQEQLKEDTL